MLACLLFVLGALYEEKSFILSMFGSFRDFIFVSVLPPFVCGLRRLEAKESQKGGELAATKFHFYANWLYTPFSFMFCFKS